jgi:Protein of unknown function (DUF1524)
MRLTRRTTSSMAAGLAAVTLSLAPSGAAHATAGQTYSAPLVTAIGDLKVAAENRTGYQRTLFPLWDDADGDGGDTREEVLISEADDPPTVGSGCSITGGRWFSYYDRVSWTDKGRIDIDHVVPLAEAWDSGAGTWTTATREAYANDLGDYRTLIGVTDSVNQAKGDQDVAEWLPTYDVCRYLRDWVAIKHRWGLTVDSTEKSALTADLSTYACTNTTITVTLAR